MTIDDKIRAVREAQTRLESACATCEPDAGLVQVERDTLAAAFFPDFIAEIERLLADNERLRARVQLIEKSQKSRAVIAICVRRFGRHMLELGDRIASGDEPL